MMTNWNIFARATTQEPTRVLARPGEATLLTVNNIGRATDDAPQGQTFNHPWRPFLSGNRIGFSLGSVQSIAGPEPIEPKIRSNGDLLPMSGKNGNSRTLLVLDPSVANSEGKSWAALEVHPDADGELPKDALVQIIHTATPISFTPDRGVCALVLILWSDRTPVRAEPIREFNLRYMRVMPRAGAAGAPKHHFL